MIRSLCTASLALALAACAATPAAYQPLRGGIGYQEQRLDADRYRVSFAGDYRMPRQTVETYLLYRSAELTLAAGRDYFVVESRDLQQQQEHSATGFAFGVGAFGSHSVTGVGVDPNEEAVATDFTASATISLHRGSKPLNDANAYDAHQVQANLSAQIVRPH
ncbi:MAG TPA: hypothetical protein VHE37_01065 [Nevskiaceae bacterium]|nr:hypothetical protein [Nevskiaceae bacterium]